MAAVLDAFAYYVADLLKQVAQDEVGMLLGVSGEIANLQEKLQSLKDYLADAERKRITDQHVQGWVRKLKDVMYDVTDILELCQLKAMDQLQGASFAVGMGCCNPLLFCLRNPLVAHDIGSRIKKLNQRLDDICEMGAGFNFIKLETYQYRRMARARHSYERKTDQVLDRSGVVGEKIVEDSRALVEKLMTKVEGDKENNDGIMVVAIVGVGGIGKTTLAKKVFNDEAVQHKFDRKIWLSITQDFNEAELLRTAITAANGDLPGAGTRDRSLLVPALVDAIRDKKFFLVLDDMWRAGEWNNLLQAPFSYGAPGSRVLVTARLDTVARAMKAVHPYHHVDKLGPEDAWSLLKKQVVSSEKDEPHIDTLKGIGMEIIAKCDGLPLAVKVMGGLLCQREKRQGDWEKVLNDSIWSVSEMPEELNYAIYLSYEDLPPYLKQCFLFYSLLPKNTVFFNDEIVSMWISEGFVHGNSDELEELGGEFYKQLILRNLIEPDMTNYADQWVCNMHDVVRSFAQYVARDEALVAHNGETDIFSKLNTQKFLRLSIETKGLRSNEFEWRFLQKQKSLRTLISVGHIKINPGDSLFTFTSLRTLHIQSAKCAGLVESLYQLEHLRYLSLDQTDTSRLPENIGKMKFLQHINLERCQSLVKLPNSIANLRQLRSLNLNDTSIHDIPRGFRGLTNLWKLLGFLAHTDGDWCSLEELGPLFQLKLLGLQSLENVYTASSAAKARLGEKVHLTDLFLYCTNRLGDDGLVKEGEGVSEEQRRIEGVFDELCPPSCLDNLDIQGYFGRRLPMWMTSIAAASLKSLRILTMDDLACCTQLPDGLCQLPCLQLLRIDRAPAIKRVGSEFLQRLYHHHSHHPSSQAVVAFPRLHEMYLRGMVEWKEWEWEEQVQAMPVLEELGLDGCKLRRLPPGLASHARALKRLRVCFVQHLNSLENFASLVELKVYENPDLERITNLPKLQKLHIRCCPKLKVLEGMFALQRLKLRDVDMETLPGYLQDVKPRHLLLDCGLALLMSMAVGPSGLEWDKFNHVEHVKAYANDGDNKRKWYALYARRDPSYNLETNIVVSSSGSTGM